jgi:transposase
LNDAERAWRADLDQRDPVLSQAASQGRQFREMIRQHQGKELTRWLDQSQRETVPEELRNFAKGLQEDEAAVRAALDSPWSNGQVEGQVNRLKTVKRQMYGRAKFDLLRRRFLLAA